MLSKDLYAEQVRENSHCKTMNRGDCLSSLSMVSIALATRSWSSSVIAACKFLGQLAAIVG